MNYAIIICTLAFSLLLGSCREEEPPLSLNPPPTPFLTSESIWGVANSPYVKVLESNNSLANVQAVLRRGDMVEILSKVGVEGGKQYWYEIRGEEFVGWVQDNQLDVFESEAQALTASKAAEN